jgi:hypothetical protein
VLVLVLERGLTAFHTSGLFLAACEGSAAAVVGYGSSEVLGISWGGVGGSANRTYFCAYISSVAVFFAVAASYWATARSRIASSVSTSSCVAGSSSAPESSESDRYVPGARLMRATFF